MAPQNGPGFIGGQGSPQCVGQNGPWNGNDDGAFPPCSSASSTPNLSDSTSSNAPINLPMLALGLALAAFLLVCLSVCLCTYRRAKARNASTRRRRLAQEELERGEYVGRGLQLSDRPVPVVLKDEDEDKETKVSDHPPPAYSPKPAPQRQTRSVRRQPSASGFGGGPSTAAPGPLLSLSPSPALAAPVSPALSGFSLSPALSQGENEDARLMGQRSLTPPPPTYVR